MSRLIDPSRTTFNFFKIHDHWSVITRWRTTFNISLRYLVITRWRTTFNISLRNMITLWRTTFNISLRNLITLWRTAFNISLRNLITLKRTTFNSLKYLITLGGQPWQPLRTTFNFFKIPDPLELPPDNWRFLGLSISELESSSYTISSNLFLFVCSIRTLYLFITGRQQGCNTFRFSSILSVFFLNVLQILGKCHNFV